MNYSKQREALYRLLRSTKTHPTAETEIFLSCVRTEMFLKYQPVTAVSIMTVLPMSIIISYAMNAEECLM